MVFLALCGLILALAGATPTYASTPLAMRGGARATVATLQAPNPLCTIGIGPLPLDLCSHFQAVIQSTLLDPVANAAGAIIKNVVTSTDDGATDANPDIIKLHNTLLLATDSFLVLVILLTGIRMIYEQSAISWSSFKETLPQVLIAFLLSQVSLSLVAAAIHLNNALIQVVLPSGHLALDTLIPPNSNGLDLFADFLRYIEALFLILLTLEESVRLPVLNLCAVLSSAGCFALAWKPTQRLGMLWLNTFLASVFLQFLQVLLLVIGLIMFKGQGQHPYVTELGGIAVSFTALALPFYIYRWAIGPSLTVVRTAKETGEQVVNSTVGAAEKVAMML